MGMRRALLIGIAQYDHVSGLKPDIVMRDISELKRVLGDPKIGGFEQINCLLDKGATLNAIRYELQNLEKNSSACDTVFIYFSGHGLNEALLPVEYKPNPDTQNECKLTNIEFSTRLNAIQAKQVVVILDACHSASAVSIIEKSDSQLESYFSDAAAESLADGDRIILTSSKGNEVSHTFDGPNSVFTKHLIKALEGHCVTKKDKAISVFDVYPYLKENVLEEVRKKGRLQTPTLQVKGSDDFTLTLNPTYIDPKQGPELCDIEISLHSKGFIDVPIEVVDELLSNNVALDKDDIFDVIEEANRQVAQCLNATGSIKTANLNDTNVKKLLKSTLKEAKREGGPIYYALLAVMHDQWHLSTQAKTAIKEIMNRIACV